MIVDTNQQIKFRSGYSKLTVSKSKSDDFCFYLQLLFVKKKSQIHFSIMSTLLALFTVFAGKETTLPVIPSEFCHT